MMNVENVPYMIIAAMVLHNICIDERDEMLLSYDDFVIDEGNDEDGDNSVQTRRADPDEDVGDDIQFVAPTGDEDIRTNTKAHAYREYISSLF